MKKSIHPSFDIVNAHCVCGESFQTKSTKKDNKISVDICSKCHPFFTGKQKLIDSGGRIDRFKKRFKIN